MSRQAEAHEEGAEGLNPTAGALDRLRPVADWRSDGQDVAGRYRPEPGVLRVISACVRPDAVSSHQ